MVNVECRDLTPSGLFVVATPIGNLSDITFRAVETLRAVDYIACEDTRRTEKLIRHYEIRAKLVRYDEHSHKRVCPRIVSDLMAGKSVALVTDAGTPGVSDPGTRLVQAVVAKSIPVVPIPGASSVTTALSVSGLGHDGFVFLGFLPRRDGRARRLLQEALGLGRTVVTLESPFRVEATLALIETLAPQADVVVAREMTKIHEEYIRGTAQTIRAQYTGTTKKGEFVLIIRPKDQKNGHDNAET